MEKIYSNYKEKKVDALAAEIIFEFKNKNTHISSLAQYEGYWLKTGEIVVNGFTDYQEFILAQYDKAKKLNCSIVSSLVRVRKNPYCESSISGNSDRKWSYTCTTIIKAEIEKIALSQKEKKLLEKSLKNINSKIIICPRVKAKI